jgi:hypothetical protein
MGAAHPYSFVHFSKENRSRYNAFVSSEPDLSVSESIGTYVPRNPEATVLYGAVASHLESFLARQQERERPVPRFVERELRAFLECGILAYG